MEEFSSSTVAKDRLKNMVNVDRSKEQMEQWLLMKEEIMTVVRRYRTTEWEEANCYVERGDPPSFIISIPLTHALEKSEGK